MQEVLHPLTAIEATKALGSDPGQGLDESEARKRLDQYGPNKLSDKGGINPLVLLWEQVSAVMVLLLLGAAGLSLLLGKTLEAGSILAIVVLFVAFGFFQEFRAEKAIQALKNMSVPNVRVRRGGKVVEISSESLVPGDIVVLEAGSVVPADGRLVEAQNLKIMEAALTGESEPVEKDAGAVLAADASLGDRINLAYSGTHVTYGRGLLLIGSTGMNTELGKIATMIQDVDSQDTPLQKRLDGVGKQLALAGVVVALVVMAMGAIAGGAFGDLILTAISVAVAVIPEGLPAVVTLTLAIGAQRMLKRRALIRRLPAVETLGSVTVICSDKTGTLTENRMTLVKAWTAGGEKDSNGLKDGDILGLLAAGALCNDASDHGIGDPTETAFIRAWQATGSTKETLEKTWQRVGEWPFDSERKRMSTINTIPNPAPQWAQTWGSGNVLLCKGAFDSIRPRLSSIETSSGDQEWNGVWEQNLLKVHDSWAAQGLRVLAVARKSFTAAKPSTAGDDEVGLTLLGLIAQIDPPRAEVKPAVATAASAGIRTIMITGDHPITAAAIAKELGILRPGDHSPVTGAELEHATDADLQNLVKTTTVFARVSPEHKLRLVTALQENGEVAAMTGDGVNDAPALKKANIGVAMGITGTDVSKEASAMVLTDDNFATIVAAVEEGRTIFDNLKRFVHYVVAGNLGKVLVMLIWPIPILIAGGDWAQAAALLPLQLLWLNLITDGLLGLSLGLEASEKGVMARKPIDPKAGIFAGHLAKVLIAGTFIAVLALAIGFTMQSEDPARAQTFMFTTLAFAQIAQAVASRSRGTKGMTPTIWMSLGILVLQLGALYIPGLNSSFLKLVPLSLADLGINLGIGVIAWIFLEILLSPKKAK